MSGTADTDTDADAQEPGPELDAPLVATVPLGDADANTDPTDAEFTVALAPRDGEGVNVELRRNGAPIFRDQQDLAFLESQHKRSTFAGACGRDSPTPNVDEKELTAGVKQALAQLDLHVDESDDETAAALRSPRERRLRDRTERVEVYRGGDETTFRVTMRPLEDGHDTAPLDLRFTNANLANPDPGNFTREYFRVFGDEVRQSADEPRLTAEEWNGLVFYWTEIAEVSEPGEDVEAAAVVEAFTGHVHQKIQAYDDPAAFGHDAPIDRRMFYTDDYKDTGQEMLVVPSSAIRAFLDKSDITLSIGELASALQEVGVMHGQTTQTWLGDANLSVWPIVPEAVEWTDENVVPLPANETSGDGDGDGGSESESDADTAVSDGGTGTAAADGGDAFERTTPKNDPRLGGDEP